MQKKKTNNFFFTRTKRTLIARCSLNLFADSNFHGFMTTMTICWMKKKFGLAGKLISLNVLQLLQLITWWRRNRLGFPVDFPIAKRSGPDEHWLFCAIERVNFVKRTQRKLNAFWLTVVFLAIASVLQIIYVFLFNRRLQSTQRSLVLGMEVVLHVVRYFVGIRFAFNLIFTVAERQTKGFELMNESSEKKRNRFSTYWLGVKL